MQRQTGPLAYCPVGYADMMSYAHVLQGYSSSLISSIGAIIKI